MFTLTATAAAEIARAAAAQTDHTALRIAAKLDPNNEIVYGMGFDAERDYDMVVETEGVTVLIAPPSQDLLFGATLDFVETGPGEHQFFFSHAAAHPAQMTGSGCGGGGREWSEAGAGCGTCGGENPGGGCA